MTKMPDTVDRLLKEIEANAISESDIPLRDDPLVAGRWHHRPDRRGGRGKRHRAAADRACRAAAANLAAWGRQIGIDAPFNVLIMGNHNAR